MFPRIILTIIMLSFNIVSYAQSNSETATANYLTHIQNDPAKVLLFLQNMPKGADLHNHLGGDNMAENIIQYGYADHLCVDRADYIVSTNPNCSPDNLLNHALDDPAFYNAIINAWSLRDFHATNTESAHDHFFATFTKFGTIISQHNAEAIAETRNRAGQQNESYIELIVVPDLNASGVLGKKIGWNSDLTILRNQLLAGGLNEIVTNMQKNTTVTEAKEKTILACHAKQAKPGCNVKVYYLYTALRNQEPAAVFAQLLAGFEIANKDSRYVGINIAQPEDALIAMRDYHLHMQMIGFLHRLYPNVHITLHAGELNSSIVPPEGLRFHIRDAIETGHAERVGHGVDVFYENHAEQLLQEMAKKQILVETNLTSNQQILLIKGNKHPLPLYLSYHVPVALSTDDEGVLRTTLTLEYKKAEFRYHLSYPTLKQLVRNSLYYSFIPGKNLWQDNAYIQMNHACAQDNPENTIISAACTQFLHENEKANMQWDLEQRFNTFEKQYTHI